MLLTCIQHFANLYSTFWGTDIQTPGIHCRDFGTRRPPITANNAVGYQLKPSANYSDKRGLTRGFLSFAFHQNPFGIKKIEALSIVCLPTMNDFSYNCFVRLWPNPTVFWLKVFKRSDSTDVQNSYRRKYSLSGGTNSTRPQLS